MKKILLIIAFLLPIKNSHADLQFHHVLLSAIVIPSIFVVDFYDDWLIELQEDAKKTSINLEKIKECSNLNKFTLNADIHNIYTGIEISGYSNIQKVQEIDSKFNFSKEKYLCINPKNNFIFKNGCLDTLEKDSIKKSSGLWSINIIFIYDEVIYIQFKNDKTKQTATTELFNIINMLNNNTFNTDNICQSSENSKN